MIFSDTWEQVIDRKKFRTRRITQLNERLIIFNHNGAVIKEIRCSGLSRGKGTRLKWIEGREYAIQPARGHKAVGRFLLTGISKERLQEITETEIKAEGIDAPVGMLLDEWKKLWNGLHGKDDQWDNNPAVWVLEIECVDPFGWASDTSSTHYFKRLPEPIFWSKKKNGEEGFLNYMSRCGNSFAIELERIDMPPGRGCQSCNSLIKHDRNKIRSELARK